jgi:integrase
MAKVDLKGLFKVTAKGRTYYYAWRGGPRVIGVPGSAEFIANCAAALDTRKPKDDGRMRALVAHYRASPAFTGLADSTRKIWTPWLDRIAEHFGDLRIAQFDRPEKIRPLIRRWRDTWADKPRSADYAIQVLSRVLTHAVDLDKIGANPCEGIKTLYRNDRAEIIWTDADLAAFKEAASPEVWWAVDLAAHTGLRAGDLKRLSWSHIGPDTIDIPTSKSRGTITAIVPLYDGLREVLAAIPRRSTQVLTNEKGLLWADGVNGTSFRNARDKALPDRGLHFHDLRGTAATRFHHGGLDNREIAEIMGWEVTRVEKIIRRYVSRSAVTQSMIRRLNQTKAGT